jgi:hypothetical protein
MRQPEASRRRPRECCLASTRLEDRRGARPLDHRKFSRPNEKNGRPARCGFQRLGPGLFLRAVLDEMRPARLKRGTCCSGPGSSDTQRWTCITCHAVDGRHIPIADQTRWQIRATVAASYLRPARCFFTRRLERSALHHGDARAVPRTKDEPSARPAHIA